MVTNRKVGCALRLLKTVSAEHFAIDEVRVEHVPRICNHGCFRA